MPRHRRPSTGLAALCGLLLVGLTAVVAGPVQPVAAPGSGSQVQAVEPRGARPAPTRVGLVAPADRVLAQLHAAPQPRPADDGGPDVPGQETGAAVHLAPATLRVAPEGVRPVGGIPGAAAARGPPVA